MDFISKLLQRKPSKSGGGSNSAPAVGVLSAAANSKEVVNLDSIDKNILEKPSIVSEKTAVPAHPQDGQLLSSSSLQSVDSLVSLPDLLPPEAAYKKQSDTDTDTTEYESAAETDHSDAVTPSGQDVFNDLQEAVKYKLKEETDLVCSSLGLDESHSEVLKCSEGKPVKPDEDEDKFKDSSVIKQCTDTAPLLSKDEVRSTVESNLVPRTELIEHTSDVINECEFLEIKTGNGKIINKHFRNVCRDSESTTDSSSTEDSFLSKDDKSFVSDLCDGFKTLTLDTPVKSSGGVVIDEGSLSPSLLCVAFSKLSLQSPIRNKETDSQLSLEIGDISSESTEIPIGSLNTLESPEQKKETERKIDDCNVIETHLSNEPETLVPLEINSSIKEEYETDLHVFHSTVHNEAQLLNNVDERQLDVKSPECQKVNGSDKEKPSLPNVVSNGQYPLDVKSNETVGTDPSFSPLSLYQICDEKVHLHEKPPIKVHEIGSENSVSNKQTETFQQLNAESVNKNLIFDDCNQTSGELDEKSFKTNYGSESDLILIATETSVVSVPIDSVCQPLNSCAKPPEEDTTKLEHVQNVENISDILSVKLVENSEVVLAEQVSTNRNEVETESIKEVSSEHQSSNRCVSETVEKEISALSSFILDNQIANESVALPAIKESFRNVLPVANLTENASKVVCTDDSSIREQVEITSTKLIPSDSDFKISWELLEVDSKRAPPSVQGSCKTAFNVFEPVVDNKVTETYIEEILPVPCASTELDINIVKKEEIQAKDTKILDELIEICNRQQKDLDQSEEEFRNKDTVASESHLGAKRYLDDLCLASDFKPKIVSELQVSQSDVIQPCIAETFVDVEQHSFEDITLEANKVAESILDDSKSDVNVENDGDSPILLSVSSRMADSENITNLDNSGNPFVTQSSLRRTPPPSEKQSPGAPKSRENSPLKTNSVSAVNTEVCEETNNMNSAEISDPFKPRTKIHNSPTRDATSVSRGIVSNASNLSKESSVKKLPSQKIKSSDAQKTSSINPEVNQSEAGPEIADGVHYQADDVYWLLLKNRSKLADVFKDSATFDFLSSIGGTQTAQDLRKQSLFTKFDPLVEPISQAEKSASVTLRNEPKKGDSEDAASYATSVDTWTPAREKVHESMHNEVLDLIDKLISVTPEIAESAKKKQTNLDKSTIQTAAKELFASDKQDIVHKPQEESEFKKSNSDPEPEMAALRAELHLLREMLVEQTKALEKERQEHCNETVTLKAALSHFEELNQKNTRKLNEKIQGIEQMSLILEEYEKTISRLVAEKEQEKQNQEQELMKVMKEKDTMQNHLENIEIAFSDVHQKYERSKQVIQGFKNNEEVLRASLAEYNNTIKKQEEKYDALKAHAMSQLESANQELDALRRSQQLEISKLKAMLKKSEIKITSLEESLEQKTKENSELVGICDELIGNVGASK